MVEPQEISDESNEVAAVVAEVVPAVVAVPVVVPPPEADSVRVIPSAVKMPKSRDPWRRTPTPKPMRTLTPPAMTCWPRLTR